MPLERNVKKVFGIVSDIVDTTIQIAWVGVKICALAYTGLWIYSSVKSPAFCSSLEQIIDPILCQKNDSFVACLQNRAKFFMDCEEAVAQI